MKRFKQYINENVPENVHWLKHAITYITGSVRYLPISNPIMNRVLKSVIRGNYFHTTNYDFLPTVMRLQGGKKSISCFSKNTDMERIIDGVHNTGCVLHIEGDLLIRNNDDIQSEPDESGRRWVPLWGLNIPYPSPKEKRMRDSMGVEIGKLKKKMVKKLENSDLSPLELETYLEDKEFFELTKKQRKVMSSVLKEYIDGCTEIMIKYKFYFKSLMKQESYASDYDENLVNNFKVKSIVDTDSVYELLQAIENEIKGGYAEDKDYIYDAMDMRYLEEIENIEKRMKSVKVPYISLLNFFPIHTLPKNKRKEYLIKFVSNKKKSLKVIDDIKFAFRRFMSDEYGTKYKTTSKEFRKKLP